MSHVSKKVNVLKTSLYTRPTTQMTDYDARPSLKSEFSAYMRDKSVGT